MTGAPTRIAVQVGGRTLRLAGAAADADPWLVAERPGPDVAPVLVELFGSVLPELVLVHPACWPAARVAAAVRELSGLARRIGTHPEPVGAAGAGPVVVLDVGHTRTEVTWVGADGSVRACRTADVGGARLDEALAGWLGATADGTVAPLELRRIREQLSLLPVVDGALAAVHRRSEIRATDVEPVLADALRPAVVLLDAVLEECGPAPVLVIGGVARAPLLAELVDAAGIPDVTVAAQPDAAAVLGALRLPFPSPAVAFGRDPPIDRPTTEDGADRADPGVAGSDEDRPTGGSIRRDTGAPAASSPFPQPRRRPLRRALLVLLAAGVAAGLLGAGVLFLPEPTPVSAGAGVLVQYGYRLEVPEGWAHTGGLPERRRVLLSPVATPAGSEVIAVERSPLGYDSGAERPRALAELRAAFDAAVAGGSVLSGYRSGTQAGREVVRYEQLDPDGRTAVDWFVLLEGDAQFSVGCRHNPTGAAAVAAACALVVGSVHPG